MLHLPARVSEAGARVFFQRRGWGNLFGLLLPRETVTPAGKRLPYLERVWIPYYEIVLRVRSGRGPGAITVSVDALSGAFALFELHDELVEAPVAESSFPPALAVEEAVGMGREQLLCAILRRRSGEQKPVIEETLDTALFHYPYWVWYYARRGGRIDIRLQDAYTGGPGGGRTRAGLIGAFVAARGR